MVDTWEGLLMGIRIFFMQALYLTFKSLFTEYYVHGYLLIVDRRSAANEISTLKGQPSLRISKSGVCVFFIAQLVLVACFVLYQADALAFTATLQRVWRPVASQILMPSNHWFLLVFGVSWWSLRLALVPAAVPFTVFTAAVDFLSGSRTNFSQFVAREMVAHRCKDDRCVQFMLSAASGGAILVVLVAALLYDGASPHTHSLVTFHWFLFILWGAAVCCFKSLRRYRQGAHGEQVPGTAHESSGTDSRLIFGLGVVTTLDFTGFVRQTCKRRSIKALLAVRALHCYASTAMCSFFHLFLTLGCSPHLSTLVRAAILAFVVAAPFLFAPIHAVCVSTLGKKRHALIMLCGVCLIGLSSLVAAFFTRGATEGAVAPALDTGYTVIRSIIAIWLCAVLLTVQRVLLDGVGYVLDLVHEDVVEEDAILFGRSTPLIAWTDRLCTVVAVPMESLGRVMTILLLVGTNSFKGVMASNSTSRGGTLPAAIVTTNTTFTVLALLSLQTSGMALLMLLIWHRYYNLEGKHLQFIQMATRKRKVEQSVALV